jgi:glucosamine--fructose-6-phosphate aminotransferase (isomerizing)
MLGVISRSGETTETIEAVSVFRERTGGRVLAITCDSHSALAKAADIVLAADFAQERSVAQTRSFSSMLVLVQALAGHLAGQDIQTLLSPLPEICDRLLYEYHDLSRQRGEAENIDRFFFLGAGYQYGIACEAMLKMKEMSLSYSEAFHPLEFRHGPMSMVDEHTLVVGLISDEAQQQEMAVLDHMRRLGGDILAMADFAGNEFNTLGEVIRLQSGLPPWARSALYLPNLQLMAYYRAMARGQDPDQPYNLAAVIKIDTFR